MSDESDVPRRHLTLVVDNPRAAAKRERAEPVLAAQLQSIASVLGVPVSTFLHRAEAPAEDHACADGTPTEPEVAEMERLFKHIQNGAVRRRCLGLMRALSRIDPDASV